MSALEPKHDGWRAIVTLDFPPDTPADELTKVMEVLEGYATVESFLPDDAPTDPKVRAREALVRVQRARDELAEALEDAPEDLGSLRAKIERALTVLRIDIADLESVPPRR